MEISPVKGRTHFTSTDTNSCPKPLKNNLEGNLEDLSIYNETLTYQED